ncbi:MAG: hypothetical protein LBP59_19535 [Planctomycetaceae bacterium]|nr:hypothetical protein [Planctomycetaceae bacterium]
MSEVLIATAFLFAFRQSAGETPAIRWSRLHSRIAGIQDREHFAWCFFRFAGETPAFQDRGRLACMRLYSTANERGFDRNRLFVCLSAKCRRDARDPLVSPAFQDRRRDACVHSLFFVTKNCLTCPSKIAKA